MCSPNLQSLHRFAQISHGWRTKTTRRRGKDYKAGGKNYQAGGQRLQGGGATTKDRSHVVSAMHVGDIISSKVPIILYKQTFTSTVNNSTIQVRMYRFTYYAYQTNLTMINITRTPSTHTLLPSSH